MTNLLVPSGAARSSCLIAVLALLVTATTFTRGQTAALPAPAANDIVLTLPAFEVSTTADKGYRAGNSVSATRIDTPIKDLPFAVSAF